MFSWIGCSSSAGRKDFRSTWRILPFFAATVLSLHLTLWGTLHQLLTWSCRTSSTPHCILSLLRSIFDRVELAGCNCVRVAWQSTSYCGHAITLHVDVQPSVQVNWSTSLPSGEVERLEELGIFNPNILLRSDRDKLWPWILECMLRAICFISLCLIARHKTRFHLFPITTLRSSMHDCAKCVVGS